MPDKERIIEILRENHFEEPVTAELFGSEEVTAIMILEKALRGHFRIEKATNGILYLSAIDDIVGFVAEEDVLNLSRLRVNYLNGFACIRL